MYHPVTFYDAQNCTTPVSKLVLGKKLGFHSISGGARSDLLAFWCELAKPRIGRILQHGRSSREEMRWPTPKIIGISPAASRNPENFDLGVIFFALG